MRIDIDDWEELHGKSLPELYQLYYLLIIILVFKDFERKNLGGCLDFYAQSDTLFLGDVLKNFHKYVSSNI